MSALSFSFRPELIPAYAQAEFISRFAQLVLDYQELTDPSVEMKSQQAPPAETLPQPSAFVPVDGDEPAPATKKERKNPWAGLTEEQRAERLAAMKRGRAKKAAEKATERRLSADSLEAAPASAETPLEEMTLQPLRDIMRTLQGKSTGVKTTSKFPTKEAIIAEIRRLRALAAEGAVASASADDGAASETSSQKKRKNPWADLTPEQKAERIAKMQAARKAKKEAAAASAPAVAEDSA